MGNSSLAALCLQHGKQMQLMIHHLLNTTVILKAGLGTRQGVGLFLAVVCRILRIPEKNTAYISSIRYANNKASASKTFSAWNKSDALIWTE